MSATIKRRLPEIIGAGPGRTGTTWLHRVLEGRVDLPYGVKETQFFSNYYDKGIDWYARHFRYATGERPIVEICPYLFDPYAPDRIKTHIPNCRVITTLRDPVEHSFSAYKLVAHYAWARGSFEEVLNSRPGLGGGNRYAFYLRKWFDTFGRENVLVTRYEELRAQPQLYLDRVTDFMGIERIALSERPEIGDDVHSFDRAPKNRRLARSATRLMYWFKVRQAYGAINFLDRCGVWDFCHGRGEPFGQLTPEQEERLRERYLPEVEALEELLAIDLSEWKKPHAPQAVHRDKREEAVAAVRATGSGDLRDPISNSGRQLRLPDFIAVGPGRTGTTWLYEVLKGHVDMPAGIKETDFFTTNYHKGIEWYARHFREAGGDRPIGEVNPYFGFPEAAERIALHIPRCKIICTFRNPVERIYSAYRLWRHYALTRFPLDEFIVKVPQVIEVTRYAKHLPDWRARFGHERVLVLLNDDLRADPQAYLDRVCDFIGIERYPVPALAAQGELINSITDLPRFPHVARKARRFMYWLEEKQAYATINFLERAGLWKFSFGGGPKFPSLDQATEARLHDLMRAEFDALEPMIGRDLSMWKEPRVDRSRAAPCAEAVQGR